MEKVFISLAVKFNYGQVLKHLKSNPTFDHFYLDSINQNIFIIFSY